MARKARAASRGAAPTTQSSRAVSEALRDDPRALPWGRKLRPPACRAGGSRRLRRDCRLLSASHASASERTAPGGACRFVANTDRPFCREQPFCREPRHTRRFVANSQLRIAVGSGRFVRNERSLCFARGVTTHGIVGTNVHPLARWRVFMSSHDVVFEPRAWLPSAPKT